MDKQKQIEELAIRIVRIAGKGDVVDRAEALYDEDCRVIPKGAVVLTREEYGELKQAKTLLEFREETIKLLEDANIRYAETLELKVNIKERKETAEKFAERLKSEMQERDYMGVKYKQGVFTDSDIDEIGKEFTGDKNAKNVKQRKSNINDKI